MITSDSQCYKDIISALTPIYEKYRVKDLHHDRKISKELILVDYRPIIRIINNTVHYAFMCFESDGMHVIFKRSFRSADDKYTDTDIKRKYYTQDLYRFLSDIGNLHFVEDTLVDMGIEFESQGLEASVEYMGIIVELNAILFFTEPFKHMQECALKGIDDVQYFDIWGIKLKSEGHTTKELLGQIYNNRMIMANIDMGEYYNRFYSKSVTENRKLFNILNEFVPVFYKFETVYNPMLTQEVQDKLESLHTELTKYEASDFYNSIVKNKLRPVPGGERYILWTTRFLYSIVTGLSADPKESDSDLDKFSFKLFNTLLYDLILRAIGSVMYKDASGIYYLYYFVGDNDSVQINYIGKRRRFKRSPGEIEERITGIASARILYELLFANASVSTGDLATWIALSRPLQVRDIDKVGLE